MFTEHGFKLYGGKPCLDLTRKKMLTTVKEFSQSLLHKTSGGCAAIVIMSHGKEQNEIQARCGDYVAFHEIEAAFADDEANPHLKGKLKFLVINACRLANCYLVSFFPNPNIYSPFFRGINLQDPVDEVDACPFVQTDSVQPKTRKQDLLVAFSTIDTFAANRNPTHGSWYPTY